MGELASIVTSRAAIFEPIRTQLARTYLVPAERISFVKPDNSILDAATMNKTVSELFLDSPPAPLPAKDKATSVAKCWADLGYEIGVKNTFLSIGSVLPPECRLRHVVSAPSCLTTFGSTVV